MSRRTPDAVGAGIDTPAAPGTVQLAVQAGPHYFLICTVVGLFNFSQGLPQQLLRSDPTPWWHYLLSWLVSAYLWALLTSLQ